MRLYGGTEMWYVDVLYTAWVYRVYVELSRFIEGDGRLIEIEVLASASLLQVIFLLQKMVERTRTNPQIIYIVVIAMQETNSYAVIRSPVE